MDRATSSTDAYVVVRFPNDTTWTSQVARKSLDPEWDETVIRNIGDDKYVRGLQLYVLGLVVRGCCWWRLGTRHVYQATIDMPSNRAAHGCWCLTSVATTVQCCVAPLVMCGCNY